MECFAVIGAAVFGQPRKLKIVTGIVCGNSGTCGVLLLRLLSIMTAANTHAKIITHGTDLGPIPSRRHLGIGQQAGQRVKRPIPHICIVHALSLFPTIMSSRLTLIDS